MVKRFFLLGIIPLVCIGGFALLEAFSLLTPIEHRVYDLALNVRPPVPEDPALLLIDVNDEALEKSETVWPWPRDLMAQGLILMKEFGASQVAFDILYDQASPPGLVASRYAGATEAYDGIFKDLDSNFRDITQALAGGSLKIRDLSWAAKMYSEELEAAKQSLLARLTDMAVDRDAALGRAARAFGPFFAAAFFPRDNRNRTKEFEPALVEKAFAKNVTVKGSIRSQAPDIVFPIPVILEGAQAAGFVNILPDQPDGVMRRIALFYTYDRKPIAQLGLAALLDYLGKPAVEVAPEAVTLKGALLPRLKKQVDIVIPLDRDGTMLVNWPKKNFSGSFRHLSFWALLEHDKIEDDLISNFTLLAHQQKAGLIRARSGPEDLLKEFLEPVRELKERLRAGDAGVDMEAYRQARAAWVAAMEKQLEPARENELVKGIAAGDPEEKKQVEELIRAVFKANRDNLLPRLKEFRARLEKEIRDSICVTGFTAENTTDIGVTPFQGDYANVGMHVAMANTILTRQFLDDAPWWLSVLVAAVATLGVYLLVFAIKRPLLSVLAGAGALVFVLGGLLVVFALTGLYLGLVSPFVSPFLVFIIFTVLNFLRTAKEKNFIRHAFTHYLSKEIITELIADPSKLNLGGEEKILTALFTDIKGFSGFSEMLAPPDLVRLLNSYFTDMGNIILGLNGTLDKYVGDAIVSFFGAPVPLERHAHHACLAAVRMKKVEKLMNEHIAAQKLSPKPVFTRIGVNSGPMLVGNMGSENKLNYTIMGHQVNLASRLEGVNKEYGTWILISESTCQAGGAAFLTRRLDRVRVVGIKEPVRIYELIDEKSTARPELFEVVDIFQQGLAAFEKRDWEGARGCFKQALKLKPDDAPSEIYLARCLEYKKKPPAPKWDGVYSLTSK